MCTPFIQQGRVRQAILKTMAISIKEKLKAEEENFQTITVYGDKGSFVHMYERSAMAFCKAVRPFKVRVQNNRDLGLRYVFVGIPADKIENYLKGRLEYKVDYPEEGAKIYVARLTAPIFSEEEYLQWKLSMIENYDREKTAKSGKKQTPANKKDLPAASQHQTSLSEKQDNTPDHIAGNPENIAESADKKTAFSNSILEEILTLQLSEYTPMKALNYLNSLQQRIRNAK